jgi:hypothetical protein
VARPAPTAGMHYPRSLGEFSSWFGTDADCLDYLEWLRRPDGFLLRGDSQHAMNHTVSGVQKVLVAIAVERFEPKGLGRCRMAWMLDGSSASLRAFLIDHVQQGATVISDGWQPYRPATKDLYVHDRVVVPGAKASDLLPGVHRIASLAQRWLLAPTRARSRSHTSQATSTSSSFASTADAHAAAAWSSTACSSSPSPTIPCATAT